jgi:hypothetical protein
VELETSRPALLASLFGHAVFASALGSLSGVAALGLIDLLSGVTEPASEIFFLLGIFTIGAFPIALVGLLLIGSPLTFFLKDLAHSRWLIGVGTAAGIFAGWAVPAFMSAGPSGLPYSPIEVLGALVGGFTGLYWAVLARRPIVRMQETSFDDTP